MRSDPKSVKSIKPHRLMQINPKAELAQGNGQFCVVVNRHSWGCNVRLLTVPDVFPVAWQHLEDTGGRIVWDEKGELVAPDMEEITHHP